MRKTTIFCLILMLSASVFAYDNNANDEYEVRYIKEQITTDLNLQQTLRHQNAWQHFLDRYPRWFVNFNQFNLKPHRAYGEPIELLNGNSTTDKVINFITDELSDFNIPLADISLLDVRENEKYKYLDFQQSYKGLQVHDSRLYIKTTKDDKLVVFGLDIFSDIDLSVLPTISRTDAINSATFGIANTINNAIVKTYLKVLPIPKNNKYNYHLFYEVEFETTINVGPAKYLCFVDAHTGELLMRKNIILYETHSCAEPPSSTSVHVESNLYAVQPYVPATVKDLVNLRVHVNGTTYYTDQNGDLTLSANVGSNVYYGLEGRWSKVETGGSTPSINTTLGTTNNISFDNDATSQERSAYYHVNVVHDYMKTIFPTFTGLDFAMTTNVDVQGSCNAFYSGGSINFYAEGNDCNSLAKIGDVVYHEYGHGINDYRYGNNGMWNGALNEGYADIWGLSITQNPILGEGMSLSDPNDFVRRYDVNKKVYPQDIVGEVHADGEIIAGCFWDTYLGFNDMGQMMDLFKYTYDGAPDGPGGTEGIIYTDILLETLMADDNDGNIYNGTPNDQLIVNAFAIHGISLLSNANIIHTPVMMSTANNDISINATIALTYIWALNDAKVHYKLNNTNTWNDIPLTSTGGTTYIGQIPAQPAGTLIAYYILLEDIYGKQSGITPMAANLNQYANVPYFILNGFEFMGIEDFDANMGFWQLGDATDNATTGLWVIDEPTGSFSDPSDPSTICQTDEDHTVNGIECAFTGNAGLLDGIGTNDVDDGHTTLFSPFYDLSNYTNPTFTYYRWYTNNPPSGANPGADWWQVLITDDGVNWHYVESNKTSDKSWRRFAFRVKDYVNLSNQVRVKFIASDSTHLGQYLDGGSLIEAAVDDFSLYEEQSTSDVNDINLITKDKKLVRITDVLGREVDFSTKKEETTLLYIYDDGTVEKKVYLDY
ncbi:MAG: hypothetical protein VX762_00965 [Bacteroidota bacterium]|nr:hypothetical protein [Bacteroidota bacterium]